MSKESPLTLSHVTLPIGDLDEAQRFYVDLLGLSLTRRFDAKTFPGRHPDPDEQHTPYRLSLRIGNGAELDLFLERGLTRAAERPTPRNIAPHPHVALWFPAAELLAKRAALAAAETPIDGPRRLGPPGHASLYFTDPWGNLLELACLDWDATRQGDVPFGPPDLAVLASA